MDGTDTRQILTRYNFFLIYTDTRRFSQLVVKATSSEEGSGSIQVEDLFTDLKEKVSAFSKLYDFYLNFF